MKLLCFHVAGQDFGVPIGAVKETIPERPLTRLLVSTNQLRTYPVGAAEPAPSARAVVQTSCIARFLTTFQSGLDNLLNVCDPYAPWQSGISQ